MVDIEYMQKAINRYSKLIKEYRKDLKQLNDMRIDLHKKDNVELLSGNQTIDDRKTIDEMLGDVDKKVDAYNEVIERYKRWILDVFAEYLIENGLPII